MIPFFFFSSFQYLIKSRKLSDFEHCVGSPLPHSPLHLLSSHLLPQPHHSIPSPLPILDTPYPLTWIKPSSQSLEPPGPKTPPRILNIILIHILATGHFRYHGPLSILLILTTFPSSLFLTLPIFPPKYKKLSKIPKTDDRPTIVPFSQSVQN